MSPKRSKRFQLLGLACFGFAICGFLFSKLFEEPRGEPFAIYIAWAFLPAGTLFFTWLGVQCVRKKEEDPFYDKFHEGA